MDITRSSLLSTMLYTALLVLLFWWGSSLPSFADDALDVSLFGSPWDMVSPIFGENSSTERMVSALLMFIISLQVTRAAIRNIIFLERTYMPAVIFVIVSAAFYSTEHSLAPLLATFLIILSLSQGMRSYPIKVLASRRLLTAGFYFGVATFVYPPSAYLLPIIYAMLSIFRIGNFREWVVTTVGVALPLTAYLFILWVLQRDTSIALDQYHRALSLNDGTIGALTARPLNLIQYTFIGVVLLLFTLSIIRFIRNSKAYKRRSALGFGFFIFVTLWVAVVMFVSPVRSLYMLPLLGLGLAMVIPTYFAANRPTFFTNFLYSLLLLSAIAIHLIN